MQKSEEKKNEQIGIAVSIGVHLILLLLFLLTFAWKEPFPPHPEYGIELNFGMAAQGSGQVQPESPATAVTDDISEQKESVEEQIETAEEAEVAKESTQEVISQPIESPVQAEPQKEKVVEKAVEDKKADQPKEPKTESKASEKPTEKQESASQGDNKEKVGDKGHEEGKLDARALMGQPGGGSGSQLDMAGWVWDYIPKPNDTSDESGRLVFEVKVNDEGEVISVRTLERSVPPSVEKLYRDEIIKLTFSKTADNTRAAPVSTGKITFIIRSK